MQKQRTQRSKIVKIEKDSIKSRSRWKHICYETFLQKKCRSFPKKYRLSQKWKNSWNVWYNAYKEDTNKWVLKERTGGWSYEYLETEKN